MNSKEKLKRKMLSGANASDKFAAADRAMAAGGLAGPAVARAPSGAPTDGGVKRPAGDGVAIRESLTLLPSESQIIDKLRRRLAARGVIPNRSEIIRAGILALACIEDERLEQAIAEVPKLKPGRRI